jgi:hypothetical protein
MKTGLLFGIASALLLACGPVLAGAGDVYVPAHRSKDGTFVPANVPPSSGGTRAAARLGRRGAAHSSAPRIRNGTIAPIFVNAKSARQA